MGLRKFPKKYTAKLSRKDKKKQLNQLKRSTSSYKKGKYMTRKKLKSFKERKSNWTEKFHKLYPKAKTLKQIEKATGIPKKALMAVKKKGMGAYYHLVQDLIRQAILGKHGCMQYIIRGSSTRKVDRHITEKYNVKFKHKPKYFS